MSLLFLAMEGQERISEGTVYTCDHQIALCKPALLPGARPEVLEELQRRRWGCRAEGKTEGEEEEI